VRVLYHPCFVICCDRIGGRGVGHWFRDSDDDRPIRQVGDALIVPATLSIRLPGGETVSDLRRCPFCGADVVVEMVPAAGG
jgi:hypothetical protein